MVIKAYPVCIETMQPLSFKFKTSTTAWTSQPAKKESVSKRLLSCLKMPKWSTHQGIFGTLFFPQISREPTDKLMRHSRSFPER